MLLVDPRNAFSDRILILFHDVSLNKMIEQIWI